MLAKIRGNKNKATAESFLPNPSEHAAKIQIGNDSAIEYKEVPARSTSFQASFTLFKAFVGSGILALPVSFVKVGFGLGIIGMLFAGFLTYYCINLIIKVSDDMNGNEDLKLQDLIGKVVGRWGKISAEFSIVIMQLGIAIAILIFSTHFLNNLTCNMNSDALCDNKLFLAGCAALIVTPLSFITNMHYFHIPSLMATFFIYLNVFAQIVYNINLMIDQGSSVTFAKMGEFDFSNLPYFFGVATYAFEGIGVVFSVRLSMQQPQNFSTIFRMQLVIVTILYTIFPGTSELALDNVPDIILFSLPSNNNFYLIIQILYVISALLGYPVQLFPALQIFENSFGLDKVLFDEQKQVKRPIVRCAIRLCVVFLLLFIALVVNSFSLFINLLGSGVFIYLGFLLPIIVYHVHYKNKVPKLNFIINIIACIISIILGVLGIIFSIEGIINYSSSNSS